MVLTQRLRRGLRENEVKAGTDFVGMDAVWRALTEELYGRYRTELQRAIAEVVERTAKVRTLRDVRKVSASIDPVFLTVLASSLQKMADTAAAAAMQEAAVQGVEVPAPSTLELGKLAGQRAAATAEMLAGYVGQSAQSYLLRAYHADRNLVGVQADLDSHLRALSFRWSYDHLAGAMTAAQNDGRRAVLGEPDGVWEASEVLDGNTCSPCLSVDGTTYHTYSEALADYPAGGYKNCVGGSRCRGTLIKILT